MKTRSLLAFLAIAMAVGPAAAQVIYPAAPATFDVEIRYRIRAARNERISQFLEMTRRLEAAGLQRVPGDANEVINPDAERIRGTIASKRLSTIFEEPVVRTVLAVPAGFDVTAAEQSNELLTVRILIESGFPCDRQRALHEQTVHQLGKLGFINKLGYDTRGDTRIFGYLPGANLPLLIGDLRWLPGGWLAPEVSPSLLPEPLRSIDPVRLVEVITGGLKPEFDAVTPTVDPALVKLSPDLRAALAGQDAAKVVRMDVVLYDALQDDNISWKTWLRTAGLVTIEGKAGLVVTVAAPLGVAREFAAMPQVASVRLPAAATPAIPSAGVYTASDALNQTGLNCLHRDHRFGQGVHLVLIDSDFAGLRKFWGRLLPANTTFLDLTCEKNPNLEPDPLPNDRVGRGTLSALASTHAAPYASLTLVRVEATAPHQILTVMRTVSGESFRTEAMQVRHAELLADNERLRQSRDALNAERKNLMENYTADEETQKKRLDLQLRLAQQDAQEREYEKRLTRFVDVEQGLYELRKAGVVANNLSWSESLPVNGSGALALFLDGPARLFDRGRKLPPVTWLQSAGDTNGQTWAAPSWDFNKDGILDFSEQCTPIPEGRWTRQLNFLGWARNEGNWTADLPAGAKFRLALQWTEAQDSTLPFEPSRFRTPLNHLRAIVLKQRDPSGVNTASDDMVVIGRPVALPQLIGRTAGGATFEHVVEWTVKEPGRYAVQLEARLADSTVPLGSPLIPAAVKVGEVFPRLFVRTVDETSQASGRPIFIDYRPVAGGLGTPADAKSAVVVGAADGQRRPQFYSSRGVAPAIALNYRPNFCNFDEFTFESVGARGTAVANGFTAGCLATMLSADAPPSADLRWMKLEEGGMFCVPQSWLEQRQHSTGLRERAAYLNSPHDRPIPRNR